jgi:hypothetical protein
VRSCAKHTTAPVACPRPPHSLRSPRHGSPSFAVSLACSLVPPPPRGLPLSTRCRAHEVVTFCDHLPLAAPRPAAKGTCLPCRFSLRSRECASRKNSTTEGVSREKSAVKAKRRLGKSAGSTTKARRGQHSTTTSGTTTHRRDDTSRAIRSGSRVAQIHTATSIAIPLTSSTLSGYWRKTPLPNSEWVDCGLFRAGAAGQGRPQPGAAHP